MLREFEQTKKAIEDSGWSRLFVSY